MKAFNHLFLLLFVVAVLSCKKEKKESENVPVPPEDIKVEMKISEQTYYPRDSISMTFSLSVSGGVPPYSFKWKNPTYLAGTDGGPHTVAVLSDVIIEADIIDNTGTLKNFKYNVIKSAIDPESHDYRNKDIGKFACTVILTSSWSGAYENTWLDTLVVSKSADITKLNFSTYNEQDLHIDQSFLSSRMSGRFYKDSVYFSYKHTPNVLTYRGKKM
jgi:hypothetical protein